MAKHTLDGNDEIRNVLARLETGEPVGVQEIANALARRWPNAVIVAGLGMLQQLQHVMMTEREQYKGG